jgi:3,4-dihydroxy-2-butanone 4-phosphate synthase
MQFRFNIIEEIRDGRMILLVDDEDRKNEGDSMIAAEKVTLEAVKKIYKVMRCSLWKK